MRGYQKLIAKMAEELGLTAVDPRHIEGYMRLEYGTLDNLSRQDFLREVGKCAKMVSKNVKMAEEVAESFGL